MTSAALAEVCARLSVVLVDNVLVFDSRRRLRSASTSALAWFCHREDRRPATELFLSPPHASGTSFHHLSVTRWPRPPSSVTVRRSCLRGRCRDLPAMAVSTHRSGLSRETVRSQRRLPDSVPADADRRLQPVIFDEEFLRLSNGRSSVDVSRSSNVASSVR